MSYHNKGITRVIRSRTTPTSIQPTQSQPVPIPEKPVESQVDSYGDVGEGNGVLGVDYHVMPDGTVHPGATHEEYMDAIGGDEHDACLDANWINMPLGVSWNTQKVDYCERAKIHSPFYVDIVGLHWFAAANNSGNYGVDYSKCCAEIISSPCPPTDLNSPFYQFGALHPDDFCKSDYCNNTNPHVDCACCPDTSTGNGGEEGTGNNEVKTIYSFNIDTRGIVMDGEGRSFSITGDAGAKFELEVKNDSNEYYNFRTGTMSSTRSVLIDTIKSEDYSNSINFAPIDSGSKTFTLTLVAVTDDCAKTKHVDYEEVRFGDSKNIGDVDVNSSIGSAGISLTKTILQGPEITWTMALASGTGTSSWSGATLQNDGLSTVANSTIKTSFTISVTAPTNSAIRLTKQPTSNDFYQESTVAISAHKALEGEDQFDGESRSLTQLVGGSGGASGSRNLDMANDIGSPVKWAIGDRVTGNEELNGKIVTVSAVSVGGDHSAIQVSEAVTVANGAALYFTPPRHYRFPAANVAILRPGMRVDPTMNGGGSIISSYERSLSTPTYIENGCDFEMIDKSISLTREPAIKATGIATFNTYGEITTQAGDIIFETPVGAEFTATSYVFQAYGIPLIESLTNSEGIKITNLKVNDGEDFSVTTTVNDASATGSASLSDFDVTSKNGIMDDISTVSGTNITSTAANPTVTTIASSTGKNITVTPGGHFLENGQSVTFNGATTVVTITGDIEILNTGTTSRSMYLDLDRFLIIASNA